MVSPRGGGEGALLRGDSGGRTENLISFGSGVPSGDLAGEKFEMSDFEMSDSISDMAPGFEEAADRVEFRTLGTRGIRLSLGPPGHTTRMFSSFMSLLSIFCTVSMDFEPSVGADVRSRVTPVASLTISVIRSTRRGVMTNVVTEVVNVDR